MPTFEWDEDKNNKNTRKHRVNFEEAKTVFDDPDAIDFEATKDGEYRLISIGKSAAKFVILVVYTVRGELISARQASKA